MRRLSGVVLAGAIVLLPAFSHPALAQDPAAGQPTQQPAQQAGGQEQQDPKGPPVTYEGDVVIAAYQIVPGKDADYEKVIATLKDALQKSTRPEAKQQLAGWKVIKNSAPQPDGSSLYVHVIYPVVPNADYSITNLVYEAVTDPMERINFYNLYRGALQKPLFVIQGPMTSDFSK